MNLVKTDAVVLRRWDYSETSLIVSLFTKTHGKMRFMVKGVKGAKSAFRGHFEYFNFLNISFDFHPNKKGLYYLKESKILKFYYLTERDLRCYYTTSYFVELLENLLHEHDADPHIFELLEEMREILFVSQDSAEENASKVASTDTILVPIDLEILQRRFEICLLHLLGFFSIPESCPICTRLLGKGVVMESATGRVICDRCAKRPSSSSMLRGIGTNRVRQHYHIIDRGILKIAEILLRGRNAELCHLKLSEVQHGLLKRFTGIYIDLHLSKPLKSRKFLDIRHRAGNL